MAELFDLRSDTVTRPSPAMRDAMAQAEVGDDVYREDPTIRRLEDRAAAITGKGAALFVPSGTMANQIALLCHTRPGDEVITSVGAHCSYYESGAASAWSGVQFAEIGEGGLFTAEQVRAAVKPRAYYCPRSNLVVVENTHNRGGGRVFPQAEIERIRDLAHDEDLGLHLDGARIWNAAAATGLTVEQLCAPFDTVSVCFSKGLGAPVGSAVCGDSDTVRAALRFRKMLGGGMRQAGILAAGALYALEHNRERIIDDHRAAQRLARALGDLDGVSVAAVETNIVNVDVACEAARVVEGATGLGVLISAVSANRLRLVTHLDVVGSNFERCVELLIQAHREALNTA
jgi:threonine aldolase